MTEVLKFKPNQSDSSKLISFEAPTSLDKTSSGQDSQVIDFKKVTTPPNVVDATPLIEAENRNRDLKRMRDQIAASRQALANSFEFDDPRERQAEFNQLYLLQLMLAEKEI